jgi:hypothetical protein
MVVPLVVPSTRAFTPFVTAAADAGLVPFRYRVDAASSTVTFWPAEVVRVKLDGLRLLIVPDAPPAAGPERALDAPPAPFDAAPADPATGGNGPPDPPGAAAAGEDAADRGEVARPTDSPATAADITPATSQPAAFFETSLRSLDSEPAGTGGISGAGVVGRSSLTTKPPFACPWMLPVVAVNPMTVG